ncbi:MAG: ArsR/SmtB family transcription factor [Thermoplasmatota archaeon]
MSRRVEPDQLLALPLRWEIFQLLEQKPSTMKEVADGVGCGISTVGWHLRKLEKYGFLSRKRTNGRLEYHVEDNDLVREALKVRGRVFNESYF